MKTKIEWCDRSLNPVKGLCPVACSFCYARRLYKRFRWDKSIRFEPEVMLEASAIVKPSRFFVGSTMELFGPWVQEDWVRMLLFMCAKETRHTFLFLTKRPWELKRYNPWPGNCWVGMTATNMSQIGNLPEMGNVDAKIKFVSFEPLLDYTGPDLRWIDWVIIGQQTPVKQPIPAWWIAKIEEAADRFHIPVFHKDNLGIRPQAKRQEWPK